MKTQITWQDIEDYKIMDTSDDIPEDIILDIYNKISLEQWKGLNDAFSKAWNSIGNKTNED